MTHEQHLILDDGPRAGLLAPDAVLDSDGDGEECVFTARELWEIECIRLQAERGLAAKRLAIEEADSGESARHDGMAQNLAYQALGGYENVLRAMTLPSEECARRAACPPGTVHPPIFDDIFRAHFGGAK